jgi:hypothetical protein
MKKLATRTAQAPLIAEFVWNHNEWVVDSVDGTKKTFGSTAALSTDPAEPALTAGTGVVFDAIPMPVGAVVCGGELLCETAYVGIGASATITVGVAGDAACYLGSTDLDAIAANGRSALLLTKAFASNTGLALRITTASLTATATAGKFRLRVEYTIDGRASENIGA